MNCHATTFRCAVALSIALCVGIQVRAAQAEILRTGGTGAATSMLQRLGVAFTAREPDITIEVVPSLGSSGGIAAVADGAIHFAVSGRPLKPQEAKSLKALVLATTPFGLATAQSEPGGIRSNDVAAFYEDVHSRWPDGTPVRVVLRPKSESDTTLLVNAFPELEAVLERLRRRSELPVAATDQDNVNVAENLSGSLTAMSLAQVVTEKPKLHFLALDGVQPSLEALESGAYRHRKDFYFVVPQSETPALKRFIAFVRSAEGERVLREAGSRPPLP